jgi:hypothetical protein
MPLPAWTVDHQVPPQGRRKQQAGDARASGSIRKDLRKSPEGARGFCLDSGDNRRATSSSTFLTIMDQTNASLIRQMAAVHRPRENDCVDAKRREKVGKCARQSVNLLIRASKKISYVPSSFRNDFRDATRRASGTHVFTWSRSVSPASRARLVGSAVTEDRCWSGRDEEQAERQVAAGEIFRSLETIFRHAAVAALSLIIL